MFRTGDFYKRSEEKEHTFGRGKIEVRNRTSQKKIENINFYYFF